MGNKDFTGGFTNLLGEEPVPKKEKKRKNKSSQINSDTRAMFIVNEAYLDKIRAIAYWERQYIKEPVNKALKEFIEKYEKENGVIKLIPKK